MSNIPKTNNKNKKSIIKTGRDEKYSLEHSFVWFGEIQITIQQRIN